MSLLSFFIRLGFRRLLCKSSANLGSHEEESACQFLKTGARFFNPSSAKKHNFFDTSKDLMK